jgi:DNA-binding SARP family transcriptional activator
MWLGVLGPLCVRLGEREVPVSAAKQRVVLAALVMRANHVVSFDELAEIVWAGSPPPSARATLRNYVKSLRQHLGVPAGARIVSREPGYLVSLGDDELDVLRFRSLCDEGDLAVRTADWQRAADVLSEALALWRGTPLADIPSDILRRDAVPPLERLRLQAVEWRVEADLNLGRHADLVLELTALSAEQPLRERFHAQLMLALYRSGRVAEALTAYEQARWVLADRLGVDPGPELRDLHERILRADAGQATSHAPGHGPGTVTTGRVAADVLRQLPIAPRHFAGRAEELKALSRLLDDAGGGRSAVVISAIGGTAGVGKTTLAIRFAHHVASRFPDGQLYVNLRGFDPAGPPLAPEDAIRGFLDVLAADPRRIPASRDAQAALYRSLVADRRMLIVLDNARDTGQVRPLLPGGSGCLVVITSRNELAGLIATEGAYPLTLDLLSADEARELLSHRIGGERVAREPEAADELIRLCARLPLALSIAAGRAVARPEFPLAALVTELRDARGRLDGLDAGDAASDVRAVFSWSYQNVSAAAGRMFRLLGLRPGPDVSVPAASSLAGAPPEEARQALRELLRAGLITEPAPGRVACHDLLHAYAAEQAELTDSEQERRDATGRLLDHYLHTVHTAALLLYPTRRPIALSSPRPGVRPEELLDDAAAMRWLQDEHRVLLAVIAHAADTGHDTHAWRLAWELARYLERAGSWHEQVAVARIALAAAQRLGDQAAQASTRRRLGYGLIQLGADAEARAQLGQALRLCEILADVRGQADTQLVLEMLAERRRAYRTALEHAQKALELFQSAGNLAGQGVALNAVGWALVLNGEYQQAVGCCEQALSLLRAAGNRYVTAATLDTLGYAHHHLGQHPEAVGYLQRALDMRGELGDRWGQAETLNHLGEAYHAMGDLDKARDAWQRAVAILDDLGHPAADEVRARLRDLGGIR